MNKEEQINFDVEMIKLSLLNFEKISIVKVALLIEYIEYYKSQLDKSNNKIEKIKEYIENNSLYEEEFDYDYEETIYHSGTNDEVAKKDILSIIDGSDE